MRDGSRVVTEWGVGITDCLMAFLYYGVLQVLFYSCILAVVSSV